MRFHLASLLFAFLLSFQCVNVSSDYFYTDDDKYNDDQFAQQMDVCENSFVEVTNIVVTCNSPYTYYYGNGAHRNSPVCDYGDKATISVTFDVQEDLGEDSVIYMTMAAYADYQRLYKATSVDLCEELVQDDCIYAGNYSFSKTIQFNYYDGEQSDFVPVLEIGFSLEDDGGYGLGGVNIICDSEDDEYIINWSGGNATVVRTYRAGGFFANYGILLGCVTLIVAFGTILWRQHGDRIEAEGPLAMDLMQNQERR